MNRAARINRRREVGGLFGDTYEGIGAEVQGRGSARSMTVTVILFVLYVLVALLLIFLMKVSSLVTDSCSSGQCDYGLLSILGWTTPVSALVILIGAVSWAVSRSSRGRSVWWVPLVAIAALSISFAASLMMLAVAVG